MTRNADGFDTRLYEINRTSLTYLPLTCSVYSRKTAFYSFTELFELRLVDLFSTRKFTPERFVARL